MFDKLFSSTPSPTRASWMGRCERSRTRSVSTTPSPTEMVGLAFSMRDMRPENVEYLTAPVLGTGMEGAARVVYLDGATGDPTWDYLRTDSLSRNADEFSDESLPDVPRRRGST